MHACHLCPDRLSDARRVRSGLLRSTQRANQRAELFQPFATIRDIKAMKQPAPIAAKITSARSGVVSRTTCTPPLTVLITRAIVWRARSQRLIVAFHILRGCSGRGYLLVRSWWRATRQLVSSARCASAGEDSFRCHAVPRLHRAPTTGWTSSPCGVPRRDHQTTESKC